MVYIHFAGNSSEEETMLQTKYQKLKKKKKALQVLKSPKPEPEKPPIAKRPAEARDAREVARKLIKSGAISAISKSTKLFVEQPQATFKRPRGLDRKLVSERTVGNYQPFSSIQQLDDNHKSGDSSENRPRLNLYDVFASARDREERGLTPSSSVPSAGAVPSIMEKRDKADKPRQGNTIYVSGYKISEDFLKKHFQTIGNIVNVSMEIEKNRGFVTFDKIESAERAIAEMDGSMVSGIQLKVSLARRQPQIEPINDVTSSSTWSTLAASHSQKGSHKDKRNLIVYDDIFE